MDGTQELDLVAVGAVLLWVSAPSSCGRLCTMSGLHTVAAKGGRYVPDRTEHGGLG